MEVKVGVQMAPRELVIETDDSDDIEEALNEALEEKNGIFRLKDSRGNLVLVPAAKIAYVEIGPNQPRRMGFGA
ncbi:MAG TPA: DUF3107 domain-containing protein [Streptosporangiaceae bacterium]|nr:DUF3107 domain-containing protein [Streptosporangiaceae bacterium]